MQQSRTADLLFTPADIIAYTSQVITLNPGDLILTGTPAGVGAGRGEFLKAGDVVKLWIENIGEIENRMA
jgi:2-keto-4-pentenoate hydratase/2-oxohepta-3-ene-1,7-dioic acid hydratase in catechol pathway